jgi:hypothetical protein
MSDQRPLDWKLDAINPRDGQLFHVIVKYDKKEAIKWHGVGRVRELIELVPPIVRNPKAVFRGVRDRVERRWLCYVGLPDCAYDRVSGHRIPPWPGKVFLVFVNANRVVYNWRWDPADLDKPYLPEQYEIRFDKQLL